MTIIKALKKKTENEIAKEVYFKIVREINKALDEGNTCHAIDLGNLLNKIIVDMGEK